VILLQVVAMTSRPQQGRFCARCGGALLDGSHDACRGALAYEPPRYCPHCRRRMVVQVTPTGWTARCSKHGELASR
jgi:hypothetical protein